MVLFLTKNKYSHRIGKSTYIVADDSHWYCSVTDPSCTAVTCHCLIFIILYSWSFCFWVIFSFSLGVLIGYSGRRIRLIRSTFTALGADKSLATVSLPLTFTVLSSFMPTLVLAISFHLERSGLTQHLASSVEQGTEE